MVLFSKKYLFAVDILRRVITFSNSISNDIFGTEKNDCLKIAREIFSFLILINKSVTIC